MVALLSLSLEQATIISIRQCYTDRITCKQVNRLHGVATGIHMSAQLHHGADMCILVATSIGRCYLILHHMAI